MAMRVTDGARPRPIKTLFVRIVASDWLAKYDNNDPGE